MINAAIIGLGWWGKNIVGAVQGKSEKLRFVHGVSKEIDAALPIAETNGFTLSDDLDKALADPNVQAVVLATPHSLHADQIVRVAGAGKPVFCEKPLTLKRADAERAIVACRKANVSIGVGQNKRFWPSMAELRRVVKSGVLGTVMHIEGHYSNENSGLHFSAWRELPTESPGGGMTGTGIHLLDAFTSIAGPTAEVTARVATFRKGPDPRDTVSVLFRFANNLSGFLGAVRASPHYWRVQVFGDEGSVEALGETETIVRLTGGKVERREFDKIDSLRAEFDAFADAVEGRAPYPITPEEMVNTVAAFEGVITSMETGASVKVG
ncbi:MAG: Gfo/Idh/MocA family oxidoreductase [Betaproteobacteria bacterium]|nr:Gfo/Idh/MocA family oxidoreductase [Betaproteobacteria bacterium]MDH3437290.1 Gfo/Idh/MocA family oxidoreductase [Betaproteobacteria bacterium]